MTLGLNPTAVSANNSIDRVLVTLVDVKGSAPREVGAEMVVYDNSIQGTIGGGSLEQHAIVKSRSMLQQQTSMVAYRRANRILVRNTLSAEFDQCCGGVVVQLFEYMPANQGAELEAKMAEYWQQDIPFCLLRMASFAEDSCYASKLVTSETVFPQAEVDNEVDQHAIECARNLLQGPQTGNRHFLAKITGSDDKYGVFFIAQSNDFNVTLFGAGHVGKALVNVLSMQDCRIRWVDSRTNIFPSGLPSNVECIANTSPAAEVSDAPAGSFFLVMTHSHDLDYEICDTILARDDFHFLGLIGSASKRLTFRKQFAKQGLAASEIDKITCPIGIEDIQSKRPEAIAVAVVAQLISLHESFSHS